MVAASCLTEWEGGIFALSPVNERVVDKGLQQGEQCLSPSPQDFEYVLARYAKKALQVRVQS